MANNADRSIADGQRRAAQDREQDRVFGNGTAARRQSIEDSTYKQALVHVDKKK
jgi:hypothetical protein